MTSKYMNDHHYDTLLSKVPAVTLFFWIIKVLCTTVGETAADFLDVNLNFGLTAVFVEGGPSRDSGRGRCCGAKASVDVGDRESRSCDLASCNARWSASV